MPYAKSSATQHRLLRTTSTLLRTQGYAATGMRDIIEGSGVPRGSVYHHFPGGKEALAASAIESAGQRLAERLSELISNSRSVSAAVRCFCDYYAEELEQSAYRKGCPLATVALEVPDDAALVHEATARAFEALTEVLVGALRGEGCKPKRARDLGVGIVASIEGGIMLAKAKRSAEPLRVVRDLLVRQMKTELAR